jgi:hypothetical protein
MTTKFQRTIVDILRRDWPFGAFVCAKDGTVIFKRAWRYHQEPEILHTQLAEVLIYAGIAAETFSVRCKDVEFDSGWGSYTAGIITKEG